jgi:hypothetical protein
LSKEWLSVQNFERLHSLISSINTISINAKLEMDGIDDSSRLPLVEQSKKNLLEFINRFELLIEKVERDKDKVAFGSDPRLGELAQRFAEARHKRPQVSTLASISLNELRELLLSDSIPNRAALVACLRDLRRLLEQHVHADVVNVLGEL